MAMNADHSVTLETEEGEVTLHPPGAWEVCPRCRGNGTHCNPAIDGNGITSSEMEELGPEFQEDYLRGVYDVPCYLCGGRRVVWGINWEKWREIDPVNAKAYEDHLLDEAHYRSICEAERRMGA